MKRLTILLCIMLVVMFVQAQTNESVRVAFWNMENFFDPYVDSTKTYNAFTEDGMQHWTKTRFYRKRNNMYKAILAMSENHPLGILGMCEVENEYVLSALFEQTPLKKHNYRWVLYEGPEPGGQLTTTTLIENFPGFPEPVDPITLTGNMRKQEASVFYACAAEKDPCQRDVCEGEQP